MLELKFNARPDENGMINGLELASEMIGIAARLINPYVHKCPACLDAVFSHIANQELETLHELVRESEGPDNTAILYCFADSDKQDQVISEALEAAGPEVAEIVRKESGESHHYH